MGHSKDSADVTSQGPVVADPDAERPTTGSRIGTLNEAPLHADLKRWYACDGDRFEERVDGFVIDIVRDVPDKDDDRLLIEIQTRRLSAIRRKLERLLDNHSVRVVTPIAAEKWLVKHPKRANKPPERRKSPKRGTLLDAFREWVSIAPLIGHPNLSLEVLLIHEEEIRRFDGRRGWRRRGWVTEERRLLRVVDRHRVDTRASFQALLPDELAEPFSTADLAKVLSAPRWLAQKVAYVMRESGAIEIRGKDRNALLYACAPADGRD
ncbi:MAG: hypothetical protein R3324_09810 [Halobacteriales archaeon]|nr:hypothetical protein [Halobacteriales archaeon]